MHIDNLRITGTYTYSVLAITIPIIIIKPLGIGGNSRD